MGFVVDKVALGQVFFPVLLFPLVSIIHLTLHTRLQLRLVLSERQRGEAGVPSRRSQPLKGVPVPLRRRRKWKTIPWSRDLSLC